MSFASRLKEQRIKMNFTQAALAEALGITKSAVGHYEAGLNSPKAEILFKVFEVLKCDANYLFQDEMADIRESSASSEEMENLVKKFRQLDESGKNFILSAIDYALKKSETQSCLVQTDLNDGEASSSPNCIYLQLSEQSASAGTGVYLGPEAFRSIKVIENCKTRQTAFCVRVSGDSMEPIYADGDIVMVSKEPVLLDDIALVTLNGNGYIKRMGDMYLISENKKYAPIPYDESVIVNGRVIGLLQPEWILDM